MTKTVYGQANKQVPYLFEIEVLLPLFDKHGTLQNNEACGSAGAVLEKVTRASGQEPHVQKAQKAEKVKRGPTDQPTDQSTDRPTDRPTGQYSGV